MEITILQQTFDALKLNTKENILERIEQKKRAHYPDADSLATKIGHTILERADGLTLCAQSLKKRGVAAPPLDPRIKRIRTQEHLFTG